MDLVLVISRSLVCEQVVSLSEVPPTSALVVAGGEGCTKDARGAASASTSDDAAIELAHSGQGGADVLEAPPGLKDLDGRFDRDFVDDLCRQAGSDFFQYGAT